MSLIGTGADFIAAKKVRCVEVCVLQLLNEYSFISEYWPRERSMVRNSVCKQRNESSVMAQSSGKYERARRGWFWH